jgi:hypothetical protein
MSVQSKAGRPALVGNYARNKRQEKTYSIDRHKYYDLVELLSDKANEVFLFRENKTASNPYLHGILNLTGQNPILIDLLLRFSEKLYNEIETAFRQTPLKKDEKENELLIAALRARLKAGIDETYARLEAGDYPSWLLLCENIRRPANHFELFAARAYDNLTAVSSAWVHGLKIKDNGKDKSLERFFELAGDRKSLPTIKRDLKKGTFKGIIEKDDLNKKRVMVHKSKLIDLYPECPQNAKNIIS